MRKVINNKLIKHHGETQNRTLQAELYKKTSTINPFFGLSSSSFTFTTHANTYVEIRRLEEDDWHALKQTYWYQGLSL